MLTHAMDVQLPEWQKIFLAKFRSLYKELSASKPDDNIGATIFEMVIQSKDQIKDVSPSDTNEVSFLCFYFAFAHKIQKRNLMTSVADL